uniref:Uncharacterized protein n=1 Tax=Ananas comosus var. bracteatus TaxID=296719 RepID=A0A6V7PEE6_ANACO|nr:unnamed protein product [Ananas comosus var. bracteatus]
MNRLRRDSPVPVRGRKPAVAAAQLLLRQGKPKDESLDLFSAIRRSESPTISSPAAAAAVAEEGVLGRSSGVDDDDLFYADVAKTDYDWLLTPLGLLSFPHAMALNTNHLQLLQKALQELDQVPLQSLRGYLYLIRRRSTPPQGQAELELRFRCVETVSDAAPNRNAPRQCSYVHPFAEPGPKPAQTIAAIHSDRATSCPFDCVEPSLDCSRISAESPPINPDTPRPGTFGVCGTCSAVFARREQRIRKEHLQDSAYGYPTRRGRHSRSLPLPSQHSFDRREKPQPALRTTTTDDNGSSDRAASECGSSINGTIAGECAKTEASESGDSTTSTKPQERKFAAARASELDLYGSTRYDMMLLKEDARNLNWLRSVDDVSAESPTFHRFEPLPEPFGLV